MFHALGLWGWIIVCCEAVLCIGGCSEHPWSLRAKGKWLPTPNSCENHDVSRKYLLGDKINLMENHWLRSRVRVRVEIQTKSVNAKGDICCLFFAEFLQ